MGVTGRNIILVVGLIVAGGMIGLGLRMRQGAPDRAAAVPLFDTQRPEIQENRSAPEQAPTSTAPPEVLAPAPALNPRAGRPGSTPAAQVPVEPPAPQPIVPLATARKALALVGSDPEAEEVWLAAINDPALTSKQRQDLIEDLNEDGFPDPKNITEDDLPLILSRLELIEEVAPDAMDDVNAAAFEEAYKDLVNMLIRLGWEP